MALSCVLSLTGVFRLILVGCCAGAAGASSFLARGNAQLEVQTITPELQTTIMDTISKLLKGNQSHADDSDMLRIQDALRTTYLAMPKSLHGKLEHAAVRYVLHSYFVQRHGWYVRGLSSLAQDFDTRTIEPHTLQDEVEEFIQGVFEQSVGAHDLDLQEIALLVKTFESLVRQETQQRLNETFEFLQMEGVLQGGDSNSLNTSQVDEVLDAYMMSYLMRFQYGTLARGTLSILKNNIMKVYPNWGETQQFLREVRLQNSHHRSSHTRLDVDDMIEQVGDRYGRWQDGECQNLKKRLLALEDTSIGSNGSGRVRLADFYGSAVEGGNWQFSESREYLKQLGSLDTQDPNVPRVIIPNYINSPSNCLASSRYYSVCCINECEDLLEKLEHHFAAPTAEPAAVIEAVRAIPSSTVQAGREISPVLLDRLQEIAEIHGGHVPLHGRLFSQWMHHAYPRECPYPHVTGTIVHERVMGFENKTQEAAVHSIEELQTLLYDLRKDQEDSSPNLSDEVSEWNVYEELYVGGGRSTVGKEQVINEKAGVWKVFQPVFYLTAVVAFALSIPRVKNAGTRRQKVVGSVFGDKDLFV